MALPHLDELGRLMEEGVGLVCLHYAVDVPKGKAGDALATGLAVITKPTGRSIRTGRPSSPCCLRIRSPRACNRSLADEWYFHMRFRDEMQGVTPILSAVPPASTMDRPDGANSGNPAVRAEVAQGVPQHVAWAAERRAAGEGLA